MGETQVAPRVRHRWPRARETGGAAHERPGVYILHFNPVGRKKKNNEGRGKGKRRGERKRKKIHDLIH